MSNLFVWNEIIPVGLLENLKPSVSFDYVNKY